MSDMIEVKKILEARLVELSDRTEEIDGELREPGDDDWAESAVEAENDEVLEGIGELAIDEINKIKSALSKIEDGTYGICERCDQQIAIKRLEAVPHATTCVACTPE